MLIVEDDADIREDLADLIRLEGYGVATAENGQAARDWLRSAKELPGLIILDLMMPVMDGRQFRAEQLMDASLATIPVILLSGAGNLPREAAALGVAGYLTKPFKLDVLLGMIDRSCRGA